MFKVVAALIWYKNKFMICQRHAHKVRGMLWEFVGGKVEPGETKEQALIRECRVKSLPSRFPLAMFLWMLCTYTPTLPYI